MTVALRMGDMTEQLPFDDETFTAVLSDPPYGLSFMGKGWDHGVPDADVWREVWRVCKPGAVLMAFGGTRTWHRLAVAIEDAGWEIEDTLMYLYGSGFPKSHDLSKAIDREAGAEREVVGPYQYDNHRREGSGPDNGDACYEQYVRAPQGDTAAAPPAAATWKGWGTALKPAWEPVILARKPRAGTYAANALRYGAGALWVDGGRIAAMDGDYDHPGDLTKRPMAVNSYMAAQQGAIKVTQAPPNAIGRWPSNLILDAAAAEALGEMSGVSGHSHWPDADSDVFANFDGRERRYNGPGIYDNRPGTASRFFQHCTASDADAWPLRFCYTAKAGRAERDAGLEGMEIVSHAAVNNRKEGSAGATREYGGGTNPYLSVSSPRHNINPCVKPLALCRYLATLLRPPEAWLDEATLFVPYAGSGSEMIGALLAGWRNVIGIERDPEYAEIATARIAWWQDAARTTGLSDPKGILNAMRKRKPTPMFG